MSDGITDEMCEVVAAARWAADEGCSLNAAELMLLAGKGAEHCGDCTDEAMTCARCLYEHEIKCARAALEAALPLIVGGERERCARIADDAAEMRERLFKETGASINASKVAQAEDIAAAIRADTGGGTENG